MVSSDPGELLRQVRRRKKISQTELADLAGTTQSAISRLEKGQRSPTVRQLAKLLAAMDEDLDLVVRERRPDQGGSGLEIFDRGRTRRGR